MMAEEIAGQQQQQQQAPKPTARSMVQSALAVIGIGRRGGAEQPQQRSSTGTSPGSGAAATDIQAAAPAVPQQQQQQDGEPKPLAERAAAAAEAVGAGDRAAEAAAPKYATPEDVERMIREAVEAATARTAKGIGDVAKATAQQAADAAEVATKRANFIVRHMADTPEVYRDLLPKTGDEKALTAAMYKINERLNADFKQMVEAFGKRWPEFKKAYDATQNIGGAAAGGDGGTPVSKDLPSLARMSPSQLVHQALAEKPIPMVIDRRPANWT